MPRPQGTHHGLDPDWLEHRLPFFERVCAPSVAAQSTRRFRWLILVDPCTPAPYLDRIESALGRTGVDHELATVSRWAEVRDVVAALAPDGTPTTRLDNDDGLSRDHVAAVQAAIRRGARSTQFVSGAVLFAETGRSYLLHQRNSPFYSMLSSEGLTAATLEQGVVREAAPPTVELEMGFLRVLHGRNLVGTHGYVGRRLRPATVLRWFAIDPSLLARESPIDFGRDALGALLRETRNRARRSLGHLRARWATTVRRGNRQ